MLLLLMLPLIMLMGCASSVPETACDVDQSLIVDIPLGTKPVGRVTNGQIAQDLRHRDEQIIVDNQKKAEARKQLDECH